MRRSALILLLNVLLLAGQAFAQLRVETPKATAGTGVSGSVGTAIGGGSTLSSDRLSGLSLEVPLSGFVVPSVSGVSTLKPQSPDAEPLVVPELPKGLTHAEIVDQPVIAIPAKGKSESSRETLQRGVQVLTEAKDDLGRQNSALQGLFNGGQVQPTVDGEPATQDFLDSGSRYVPDAPGLVDFKVRAPKAVEIWVEILPEGAPKPSGTLALPRDFSSQPDPFAGSARDYDSRIVKMQSDGQGVFRARVDGVAPGSVYRYLLRKPGLLQKRADVLSSQMAYGVEGGWSKTVDHPNYRWSDFETKVWRNESDPPTERILSGVSDPEGRHVKPVVAELNVSLYGGFSNSRLRQAIASLQLRGVNTIHLMPVEDFYGSFSWGYEGVQSAAPATAYGTPEELKALVAFIHRQRMSVVLDVVFNHRGPFYSYLDDFFAAFHPDGRRSPWGRALNYDGAGSEAMRELVIATLHKWAHDYHFDGFRFDMTKFMDSDSMLKEIVLQLRRDPQTRDLVLIAEDGRNSHRVTAPLDAAEYQTQAGAEAAIQEARAGRGLDKLGFDYEWYFDKVHVLLAALVTQRKHNGFEPSLANLEQVLTRGSLWSEQGVTAPIHKQMAGVTHDEIGNNGGTREIAKALISILNLLERARGDGRKADQAAFAFLRGYVARWNGDAEGANIWDAAEQLRLGYIGDVNDAVTFAQFAQDFPVARKRYFQSLAVNIIASPDAKLEFDRPGELGPWRFYARYPDPELRRRVSEEKGYDVSGEGLPSSLPDQAEYSLPALRRAAEKLHEDAVALWMGNAALRDGEAVSSFRYEPNVLQIVRRDEVGNEFLILINRSDLDFPTFALHGVPAGSWERVFTTDAKGYGGREIYDAATLTSAGAGASVALPGTSVVVFKRQVAANKSLQFIRDMGKRIMARLGKSGG